ncbi:hypothetical protein ACN08P_23280 (plasmid) [Photobacterium leiognathi subsp. mandapamensis]|uniref:hypothetical protein n=1 Tax=Photobacterium leiognathi TaxID=553611 RepID=UPI003AF38AA9
MKIQLTEENAKRVEAYQAKFTQSMVELLQVLNESGMHDDAKQCDRALTDEQNRERFSFIAHSSLVAIALDTAQSMYYDDTQDPRPLFISLSGMDAIRCNILNRFEGESIPKLVEIVDIAVRDMMNEMQL